MKFLKKYKLFETNTNSNLIMNIIDPDIYKTVLIVKKNNRF